MQPIARFLRLAKITLVFVYLVIIAGSVVRATGSGMGCPDWPKCFGHWIPPTNLSQLPPDYQERYKVQGKPIEQFNAVKTWTESMNRYVTGILGILLLLQVILAFGLRKTNSALFRISLMPLLFTFVAAGLGAVVVLTNLQTSFITVHMLISLLILSSQAFLVFRASEKKITKPARSVIYKLIPISIVFTVIQIILGTQVRTKVDVLLKNFDEGTRGDILNNAGMIIMYHSAFAWITLLLNLVLVFQILKDKPFYQAARKQVWILTSVLLLEIAAGVCLKLFALPAFIQPVHLLLASMLFGIQWELVMRSRFMKKEI
jgi:cytochrome c oxidase assembly protein subunit 15